MTSTDDLLRQANRALDEFDDVSLDVSIRRAVRLASLLGEAQIAVRLSLELRSGKGGSIRANRADLERLMREDEPWDGGPDSPHERAVEEFMQDRALPQGGNEPPMIYGHSITDLVFWVERMMAIADDPDASDKEMRDAFSSALGMREVLDRVRHRTFTALCSFERRLAFAGTNEDIYRRFQREVDGVLAADAPHVLDAFTAVYRRLREATTADQAGEELSHAVTSCRRILKAVADLVYPTQPSTSDDGHVLDDERYRNRIKEWTKTATQSGTLRQTVGSLVGGIYERFVALDSLASKGVHAELAVQEAELCAISTYVVAGEILRLNASHTAS